MFYFLFRMLSLRICWLLYSKIKMRIKLFIGVTRNFYKMNMILLSRKAGYWNRN